MYEGRELKIKDIAVSERPRERLLEYGAGSLSNAELLAILISSGTKDGSALDLAYRLLASEKRDITAFANYQPEEYFKVKGIGKATACKIAAAVEFGRRVSSSSRERMRLDTPELLSEYFSDMRNMHKEVLRIAMYNSKSELIKYSDISMGGIAGTSAIPREVFADAIRAGAKAIIVVHNHPSGDPTPSKEDVKATELFRKAGKIIGIDVMDHLIIGDGIYYSFREAGILPDV